QADQWRPGLASLAGPRLPLRDPTAADLDELVYPPDAALVPLALGGGHVLRRTRYAVLRLRTEAAAAPRVRQPGAAPAPDRGDGQLWVLQRALDHPLPVPAGRPGL